MPTVNLIFLPVSPKLAPNTSPVLYPNPLETTVATPTEPLAICTLIVAPLPSPVILVNPIPE